jgi:ArsR family transcriptional regulator
MSKSESLEVEAAGVVPDVTPDAAELLKLLADRIRRQIFLLAMRGEVCNCELATALGLPQNLVSHHIRKLREAGLVDEHRDPHDGRWIHYTVNLPTLASAWEGLREALHPAEVGTRLPACRRRGGEDTGLQPKAAVSSAVAGS